MTLIFCLFGTVLYACGGSEGSDGKILEASNERAAFSVLKYVETTTISTVGSQMNDKDKLSFKLLSGNSEVEKKEGNGRTYVTYQYTIRGEKVKISQSYDVKNYGIVKIVGTESTVVSNPRMEQTCPNFSKNEAGYIDISLVNKVYQKYNNTGVLDVKLCEYTVSFINYNGQFLEGKKVIGYGSSVKYTGSTPTREKDAQYTYYFSGWDGDLNCIKKDTTFRAQYSVTTNSYSVVFKNYNGEVLYQTTVNYGVTPTYSGRTPTKPSDDEYRYVFKGWDRPLESVTGPTEYIAQYNRDFLSVPKGMTFVSDNNGGYIVSSYSGSETSIVIPTIHFDQPVTGIGSNAFNSNLFNNCSSLTSIIIPNSVTSIGDQAFRECINITSIIIPNSVTSIGEAAFTGCTNLQIVTFESESKLTSIGAAAFYGCSSLTSIIIPNSVTNIEVDAFRGCINITSIIIPNNVTSIRGGAFFGCTSLQTVTFEGGSKLTSIERGAFYKCSSLSSIVIPSSVTSIGDNAFFGCSSLTSITIPNSVTSIGKNAFYECSSLTIYCEADSQPSGWDNNWNPNDRPVYWGYKN